MLAYFTGALPFHWLGVGATLFDVAGVAGALAMVAMLSRRVSVWRLEAGRSRGLRATVFAVPEYGRERWTAGPGVARRLSRLQAALRSQETA